MKCGNGRRAHEPRKFASNRHVRSPLAPTPSPAVKVFVVRSNFRIAKRSDEQMLVEVDFVGFSPSGTSESRSDRRDIRSLLSIFANNDLSVAEFHRWPRLNIETFERLLQGVSDIFLGPWA